MHLGFVTRLAPVVLLALCACATQSGTSTSATAAPVASALAPATSNGQAIFQTGRDASGKQIVALKTPLIKSCAACHRADGAGGVHLSGGAVSADLRHAALTSKQKVPYTVSSLERAISTGVDNLGKPLDPVMPRWKLSKQDLHDVATYVFTQLK
ncbi:MAG: cytochrome c [Candidatus Eremiobacteraeota bacterium]|nr:cytochrome c [Candidatus Eremiobacteraeota bacterium]